MRDSLKIVCFGDEPWNTLGKRVQNLMRCLSERESVACVLYVNQPVDSSILDVVKGRFPSDTLEQDRALHFQALSGRLVAQVKSKIWIYTGSQKILPLTRFSRVRRLRVLRQMNRSIYSALLRRFVKRFPGDRMIVWLSNPMQAYALDVFPDRDVLVYDWMDAWEHFEGLPVEDPQELLDLNDKVVQAADVVFAVSRRLWERAQAMNHKAFLIPNATDYELFGGMSDSGPMAPEILSIPSPRIGYLGRIGDRVDFALLEYVARARPEWSIVLIGPVWKNRQEEAKVLAARPNVYFLGPKRYKTLPTYVRGFDVCTIPHTCDELTASMDPIKLYDYLATGKPIVSTHVAGVDRFADVVYIGDTPEEFMAGLEAALCEDGSKAGRRLAYARENTWPQRAEQVWRIIGEVLSDKESSASWGWK